MAGNPNSGKTTLFNTLTGAHQHVGNYPGVTVECKKGTRQHGESVLNITDLPRTYSLTAYTAEELIARNSMLNDKPDVVVDVIDTTNLERNLYLAVQLMELNVPLVLAFNMSDMAKARGLEFDLPLLSRFFNARIVPTIGHKGGGIPELLDAIVETPRQPARYGFISGACQESVRSTMEIRHTISDRIDAVVKMGIVYSVGEADEESEPLREQLAAAYNPLIGFCIMLFCLISAPCMATIAVTKRESNSWAWALFQLGGLTALAWILTTLVYQVGRLTRFGV